MRSKSDLGSSAKSRGTKGKGISPYNKFMKDELARLKEDEPDMPHPERSVIIP